MLKGPGRVPASRGLAPSPSLLLLRFWGRTAALMGTSGKLPRLQSQGGPVMARSCEGGKEGVLGRSSQAIPAPAPPGIRGQQSRSSRSVPRAEHSSLGTATGPHLPGVHPLLTPGQTSREWWWERRHSDMWEVPISHAQSWGLSLLPTKSNPQPRPGSPLGLTFPWFLGVTPFSSRADATHRTTPCAPVTRWHRLTPVQPAQLPWAHATRWGHRPGREGEGSAHS